MKSVQSWNNILSYIKANLGVPINMLELSDDDLVTYLSENTLVEFSNYVPKTEYTLIDKGNLVDDKIYKYEIPVNKYIIDVVDVYTLKYQVPSDMSPMTSPEDIIKRVIENKYSDIVRSLNSVITFKFEQPKYLIFFTDAITQYLPAVVEYQTVYDNLNEIPADMYQYFKKLCLADTMIMVGNMRSKFQLSTPFGQIMTNADELKQLGMQLRQEVLQALNTLPPDKLIVFI